MNWTAQNVEKMDGSPKSEKFPLIHALGAAIIFIRRKERPSSGLVPPYGSGSTHSIYFRYSIAGLRRRNWSAELAWPIKPHGGWFAKFARTKGREITVRYFLLSSNRHVPNEALVIFLLFILILESLAPLYPNSIFVEMNIFPANNKHVRTLKVYFLIFFK